MYIKNISPTNVVLGGARFVPNEIRPISDIGTRDRIIVAADEILQKFADGKIEVQHSDGEAVSGIVNVTNLLLNGFVSMGVTEPEHNYYFLKDKFKLKKGESIEKAFIGVLTSLWITPSHNETHIMITTHQGVQMPADNLTKNQTIEFNFDKGIKNPIIEFSSAATTDVDVFLEGYDTHHVNKDLQRFINTWKEDDTTWTTAKPLEDAHYFNPVTTTKPIFTEDDINGHKFVIDSDQLPSGTESYKIYKLKDNDYAIEKLTDGTWDPFNTDRFYFRIKNVKYVTFNDVEVDLTTATLASFTDHATDRLGD